MGFYGILWNFGVVVYARYCIDLCASENTFFIPIPPLAFEKLERLRFYFCWGDFSDDFSALLWE